MAPSNASPFGLSMTAPTHGLGAVVPRTPRALFIALSISETSVGALEVFTVNGAVRREEAARREVLHQPQLQSTRHTQR